jgi:hypothetical protein
MQAHGNGVTHVNNAVKSSLAATSEMSISCGQIYVRMDDLFIHLLHKADCIRLTLMYLANNR